MATFSYIAKPQDHRCRWWSKIFDADKAARLNPRDVTTADTLPGSYERKNADHELAHWTFVCDGEALHHRHDRGWRHRVGVVYPREVTLAGFTNLRGKVVEDAIGILWITPTQEVKTAIKAAGADTATILGGSGPNAGMARIAAYIAAGHDDQERRARLRTVAGIMPTDASR